MIKDTAANIFSRGEFVVNLVSELDAPAINLTSKEAPPEVSEVTAQFRHDAAVI